MDVFTIFTASLGSTLYLLQESDTNKVLTGPHWHLKVGTVKENKIMGNKGITIGHFREEGKSIILFLWILDGAKYWEK